MSKILGTIEAVDFPEFDAHNVMAKIDTGAYTGALHCSSIKEHNHGSEKTIIFVPFGSDKIVEKDEFVIRYVRSSNGERERRYFIKTNIVIHGHKYPITLSLANRSEMKWPVLIGRRFLKQNHFLVDPSRGNGYREQVKEINDV